MTERDWVVEHLKEITKYQKRLESTPEEMKAMVGHELEKWRQVVADGKIPKQ